MKCPFCGQEDSRVINSRSADDGKSIRRRRECIACSRRFTTYETVEMVPLIIIKNDGRRVEFDRNKLQSGILRSCYKRDIPTDQILQFALSIEKELYNMTSREIPSKKIGELVMERLRHFDAVAYIRFASVYRKFTNIDSFTEEVANLRADKK